MKAGILIARVVLGLAFVVFGLNIIHPFMPQPPMPEDSLPAKFMAVMVPTHWITVVGVAQLLGGLLVLIGRTAPLGLMILAPVLVNILSFHIFLTESQGMMPGLIFTALEIFLIYAYRSNFRGVLTTHATPTA